jgi:hypothetical protein
VKSYAVAIGFSFNGKPLKDGFCHIVTYNDHVNLGFNRGASLSDPKKLLVGKGKSIRHITIRDHKDLDDPWIRRFVQAAIEQVRPAAEGTRVAASKRSRVSNKTAAGRRRKKNR